MPLRHLSAISPLQKAARHRASALNISLAYAVLNKKLRRWENILLCYILRYLIHYFQRCRSRFQASPGFISPSPIPGRFLLFSFSVAASIATKCVKSPHIYIGFHIDFSMPCFSFFALFQIVLWLFYDDYLLYFYYIVLSYMFSRIEMMMPCSLARALTLSTPCCWLQERGSLGATARAEMSAFRFITARWLILSLYRYCLWFRGDFTSRRI